MILNKKNTIIFMSLLTAWRVFLCFTMQLHQDEAYYWLFSKHLALGYFDHPPMVGYFIWLTTLFSNTEFWVRFSGLIVVVAVSIITWKLAKSIYESEAAASASVILLNLLPVTMSGALIITPDTPAFLFWALSVFYCWKIVKNQKASDWYWMGLFFGLAMFSKYTAVLFAPCLFLFLILTDERRWLKTVYPYMAGIVSFLAFSPVVFWNWQNNWISFKFQLGHGLSAAVNKQGSLIEYIGGQFLAAGPFFWIAGVCIAVFLVYKMEKQGLFLSLFSLPIILFFGYASIKKSGEANWPALAYFTMSILLSGILLKNQSKLKSILLWILIITSGGMSITATLQARFGIFHLERFNRNLAMIDATNFFYGWKELGSEITAKYKDRDFVITHSHQLSALIAYYTNNKVKTYTDEQITRFSQFDLWELPYPKHLGQNGLYIYANEMTAPNYRTYFEKFGVPASLAVYRNGFPIRNYTIIPADNYKYKGNK